MAHKGFRITDETLMRYENLKQQERITSDADFFGRLLDCLEINKDKKFIPIEVFIEKDKELKALYVKIGELQGELNIYKQQSLQQTLPKKSFWKRLFGLGC